MRPAGFGWRGAFVHKWPVVRTATYDAAMAGYSWSGYASPERGLLGRPVSLDPESIDPAAVRTPPKSISVWARLLFPDGERTVKGFAMKWTQDAVYVQYVDSVPVHVWVRPVQVRRREINDRTRSKRVP